MNVIKVENLSKRYTIRHQQRESYTALRDVMANGAKRLGAKLLSPFTSHLSSHELSAMSHEPSAMSHELSAMSHELSAMSHELSATSSKEDFWALKDVSFEVKQGEVIGIIGRNGAGKSTLLKILSRITEPTTGSVKIKGRVASLLEVGTGFHPELTGRENVYLNGAILGMTKAEIKKKFDEIVAFAEIEKFLDTPVKRYSSGMYVRLAFAVAAHLEPEILIIDEVLAVGDVQFQKKCMGKMGDVAKGGRTVLFVSHNMDSMLKLCNKCMLLVSGKLAMRGETAEVILKYLQSKSVNVGHKYISMIKDNGDRSNLVEAEILNSQNSPCDAIRFGEPFSIRMQWRRRPGISGISYALRVFDVQERFLFAANTLNSGLKIDEGEGLHSVVCRFGNNVLVPGEYNITIGCYIRPHTTVHVAESCLKLKVVAVPYRPSEIFNIVGNPLFVMHDLWINL